MREGWMNRQTDWLTLRYLNLFISIYNCIQTMFKFVFVWSGSKIITCLWWEQGVTAWWLHSLTVPGFDCMTKSFVRWIGSTCPHCPLSFKTLLWLLFSLTALLELLQHNIFSDWEKRQYKNSASRAYSFILRFAFELVSYFYCNINNNKSCSSLCYRGMLYMY